MDRKYSLKRPRFKETALERHYFKTNLITEPRKMCPGPEVGCWLADHRLPKGRLQRGAVSMIDSLGGVVFATDRLQGQRGTRTSDLFEENSILLALGNYCTKPPECYSPPQPTQPLHPRTRLCVIKKTLPLNRCAAVNHSTLA